MPGAAPPNAHRPGNLSPWQTLKYRVAVVLWLAIGWGAFAWVAASLYNGGGR